MTCQTGQFASNPGHDEVHAYGSHYQCHDITLIPVFPKKRLIMRAYQSVRPISKVAIKHAAASSALEIHPGLSLEE
jgi:hypothetical protein